MLDKVKESTGQLAFRIPEAAAALSVCRGTVYSMLKRGKLRYVRLPGGEIRVPRQAIEEYLNPQESSAPRRRRNKPAA